MRYLFLLLCLKLLLIPSGFSQILKGQVLDSKTSQPLAFVHIGILNSSVGTISDQEGFFRIDLENTNPTDSLSFSMIGYKNKLINLPIHFEEAIVVALDSENYNLQEIFVAKKRIFKRSNKTKKLGRSKARNNYTGSSRIGWGGEIGIKIRAKNKIYKVKDINFKVMEINFDSVLFRVNIYSIKNKLPHESILHQNIFLTAHRGATWVSKNLEDQFIFLEEDVIVTVESIKAWSSGNRGSGVFYNNGTVYHSKTYTKDASMARWRIGEEPKLSLYLTVEKYQK